MEDDFVPCILTLCVLTFTMDDLTSKCLLYAYYILYTVQFGHLACEYSIHILPPFQILMNAFSVMITILRLQCL